MNLVPNSLELHPTFRSIDEIPLDKRKNICTSIDYSITRHDGYWEKLVNELGFTENDSKNFQLAFAKNQSPTENLLRECSYRNYKIRVLYHVLKKIGLVKLAEENLDNLDENFLPNLYPDMAPYIPILPHPAMPSKLSNEKPRRGPTESSSSSSSISGSESEKIGGLDTFHFAYEDIQRGTDDFANDMKLGAGAFGKVYKVRLKNTTFACKVLTINKDSHFNISIVSKHREHSDLKNELRYLAEYRHPNIIPLYGWSLDGRDPCLIYQYMENGSLQDCLQRLKGNTAMKWITRVKVACDAARGLQFLHTAKEKPLIHGDIKTANILLDESFVAKLGDFGLAREGPRSRVTGSYIKLGNEHTPGTIGYLAKEYMDSKKLSVQVDTYAFGVVLLELYTGRRAYDRSERKATLLRDYMEDVASTESGDGGPDADTLLFDQQDPHIERLPRKTALEFVKLAMECCHFKRNKRPPMLATLDRLEKIRDDVKITMHSSDMPQRERPAPQKHPMGEKLDKSQRNQNTYTRDTHNLSRVPIEDDDHSIALNLSPNHDPSLPHENSNIYGPNPMLSQQLHQIRISPHLQGQMTPDPENQKQSLAMHLPPGMAHSPFPSYPSNQSSPFLIPNSAGMSPIPGYHPMLQPQMTPMPHMWNLPVQSQYAANMSQNNFYPYFPQQSPKLPPQNVGYDMLDPNQDHQATTPISPGIGTPDAFSSLELNTPNLPSPGQSPNEMGQNVPSQNNGVPYANLAPLQYCFPPTAQEGASNYPGDNQVNGLDSGNHHSSERKVSKERKLIPPKPHSVTMNDVKAGMINLMESGCESFSQIFESPPKLNEESGNETDSK